MPFQTIDRSPSEPGGANSVLIVSATTPQSLLGIEDPIALGAFLLELGWDVHVVIPGINVNQTNLGEESSAYADLSSRKFLDERVHLTGTLEDSFGFQRSVVEEIIPDVQPKLIHCTDFGTALIPAATRKLKIPCLLTVHNLQTCEWPLAEIESRFGKFVGWRFLYYRNQPAEYDDAKAWNEVDLLASGIFSAHWLATGSGEFLNEISQGRHNAIPRHIVSEILSKKFAKCTTEIPYGVSPVLTPKKNPFLTYCYSENDHVKGKLANKKSLQKACKLASDDAVPLFLWFAGSDSEQSGYRLLTDSLFDLVTHNWAEKVQVALIAREDLGKRLLNVVELHSLASRVAVIDLLSAHAPLAFAAADFLLAPSLYEPSALPQKLALTHGCIPVAFNTGANTETVIPLDVSSDSGNGFLFKSYGLAGLMWGVEQALGFFRMPKETTAPQTRRIMIESMKAFDLSETARIYAGVYRRMLARPMRSVF